MKANKAFAVIHDETDVEVVVVAAADAVVAVSFVVVVVVMVAPQLSLATTIDSKL